MEQRKGSPSRYALFRKERRERQGRSEKARQVKFEGQNSIEEAAV